MEEVLRVRYLKDLEAFSEDADLIKIVTGVRRCGKSTLLNQFSDLLLHKGIPSEDIIHIDLEERRGIIDTLRMLEDTLRNILIRPGMYLMMDEVQLIDGWQKAVDTARLRYKANVFITGSNSVVFSSELSTDLTGRYVEIHVLPFSFREYVQRYPIDLDNGYPQRLRDYMRWGGMPGLDMDHTRKNRKDYLGGLYESIVNKDIRNRIELEQWVLTSVQEFMMSNIGNLTNSSRIVEDTYIGDKRTAEKYLNELCKSYVFYKADRYDVVGSKHLSTNAKFYVVDNGFVRAVLGNREMNDSALLENVVYLELVRRGFEVSVGSYRKHELDFTVWDDDGPMFYQVCLDISDERTLSRELATFGDLRTKGKCVLIYLDGPEPDMPEGTEAVNAIDWLLDDGCE